MLKKIILLEYFTSLKNLSLICYKNILPEANAIICCIVKGFLKYSTLKEINVIRNEQLDKIKDKRVIYHYTNSKTSVYSILKRFKNKNYKILLIAPETNKISLKLHNSLEKNFKLLNCSQKIIKTFASKKLAFKSFKEKGLPCVENLKASLNSKMILKPTHGTGSEGNQIISGPIHPKKDQILQKFHNGLKGSFTMICNKNKFKIISCNIQIIKLSKKSVNQVGLIYGGLENWRTEIQYLGKQICKNYDGLFGYIGVDIVLDNKIWKIIEINPRLTSSLIGLEQTYGNEAMKEVVNFYVFKKLNHSTINLKKKKKILFANER